MGEDRVELAERFLEQAVFRSRSLQAVRVGLAGASGPPGSPGNCGLGEKAAVELELTDRGAELFQCLWPEGVGPAVAERLRDVMADWVTLQDSLDRKRNHFIRDFRRNHGPDRREYSDEVARDFEKGLERINDEVRASLRNAAQGIADPV